MGRTGVGGVLQGPQMHGFPTTLLDVGCIANKNYI